MLSDPKAIEIISRARQKNVAAPERSDRDFVAIFAAFFDEIDFAGQAVLDLGPGQYDFARAIRARGADAWNMDRDPAVLELGRYLGFNVIEADFRRLDARAHVGRFDGLFCKFSINAFWFESATALADSVADLDRMLAPGGWGWIAPWNGVPKSRELRPDAVDAHLRVQAEAFEACGWESWALSDRLAARFGMSGAVANHALFLKNIALRRTPNGLSRLP